MLAFIAYRRFSAFNSRHRSGRPGLQRAILLCVSRSTVSGNGRSANAKQNGALQTRPAASMARIESGEASIGNEGEHVIDDQGTDQSEASEILRHIRDNAFEANDEKLALALGRPTEEIEEWTSGRGLIDGDVIMKARTLAMQRGFEI